ncbi:hypothetical protein CLV91_0324 [Maribacter vaceletii]|uniref:SnoaL-like protein n=2 Tax=Maribacter vaceletii TaxID=1206816 RepID=A0A495ECA5_9FLAO|nr:hypothetical protein CLV91_0324 [Maribacter vaceletii]
MLLLIGFMSCKNYDEKIEKLTIAKEYYKALNNSNDVGIEILLRDSLLTKESNYKQTFSIAEYKEWLQWDAIFEPTYITLDIKEENEVVKATISKMDKRILFLHEKPIVTKQTIHFKNTKISSIETTDYLDFKDTIFIKNRTKLLNWVSKKHPELDGFIYDQTKKGGQKYLKAIELYNQEN